MEYVINFMWDSEAEVWIATNDEIPLALESGSFDALVERVKNAIPELIELNSIDKPINFVITTHRKVALA